MVTKKKWNVRLDTKGLGFKIYIDEILFLFIKDSNALIGIQSWKQGKDYYCIELYVSKTVIKLEFNDIEKWKSILNLMNEL